MDPTFEGEKCKCKSLSLTYGGKELILLFSKTIMTTIFCSNGCFGAIFLLNLCDLDAIFNSNLIARPALLKICKGSFIVSTNYL